MPNIYLPADAGPVVQVDGICYRFVAMVPAGPVLSTADAVYMDCAECAGSSAQAGDSSAAGGVDCNSCDPPLQTSYGITLSGQSFPLVDDGGPYTVTYMPVPEFGFDCEWHGTAPSAFFGQNVRIFLTYSSATDTWDISFEDPTFPGVASLYFSLSDVTGCMPLGTYSPIFDGSATVS